MFQSFSEKIMIEEVFPFFPWAVADLPFAVTPICGIAFLFHGYRKVIDTAGFASEFKMPAFVAAVAAWTQFGAGLLRCNR
jgi:hypothetical protein